VFFCLPQALSSADMVSVSNAVTDAAKHAGVQCIVRISSARIDAYLSDSPIPSQGPLGEAHVKGEVYTKEKGITLTSIRPTSFSTNFIAYDLPSIKSTNVFASPLGPEAAVNWVCTPDIAGVAVRALLDRKYDGQVLDVTGPATSTLTAAQMQALLERTCARSIEYKEVSPPPIPDLQGLWGFLRAGGFDLSSSVVRDVTGKEPQDFADFLGTLDLTAS